ncbi:hypothetical protein Tco_0877370 [Tanacetum coccineum]|uniref:Uncharacterized protein n=1 Tax=Tanacetum coccineum TaxID=301880 RepID=A0ABQ5BWP5_9ASTR
MVYKLRVDFVLTVVLLRRSTQGLLKDFMFTVVKLLEVCSRLTGSNLKRNKFGEFLIVLGQIEADRMLKIKLSWNHLRISVSLFCHHQIGKDCWELLIFAKNTGRNFSCEWYCDQWVDKSNRIRVETTTSNALISCDGLGNYDWSDQAEEGPTNFVLMTYSSTSSNSKSCSSKTSSYTKNKAVYEEDIKVLKRKIHLREVAITELRRKLELAQKQKDKIQLTVENFENSSKNISKLLDCQIVDKYKPSLGYNAIPPPYTGTFMPLKPDLSFSGLEEFVNKPIVSEPTVKKPVVETSVAKASEVKPKVVRKNNGAPIIEDWVSNSEEEDVPQAKIEKKIVKSSFAKIEFVKSKEQVKSPRKTVNHRER